MVVMKTDSDSRDTEQLHIKTSGGYPRGGSLCADSQLRILTQLLYLQGFRMTLWVFPVHSGSFQKYLKSREFSNVLEILLV